MKVLVTGSKGQLGFDIIRVLEEKQINYVGIDKEELDITDEFRVKTYINDIKPSVIIHCAAYTSVDKAENEKKLVYAVNVLGTRYLSEAARDLNAKFLYISTDYVFDGEGEKPFNVNDKPNPVNYYGKSKYEGELEVSKVLKEYYIVRISWVFGINGNNFVKTMLGLSETKNELTVVSDQVGSPTYTFDLAYVLCDLINTEEYGIHHITNDGFCSWNEFAKEIFKISNKDIIVKEILTKNYKTIANRPLNSRLEKNKIRLRPWKEALIHFAIELKKELKQIE